MAEFSLPTDLNLQWASSGDILKPSDTKVQQGWQPEIPARQHFNWLDNRQDQAIAHIAQHGISVWSSTLEYQAGKSYVQGSDGLIYKSLTTNTNINPVGGAPGNWGTAFITPSSATQVASAAQAQAQTANNVYISPLALANASKGANQSLISNGFQKLPGGLIIQWGGSPFISSGGNSTFALNVGFPNALLTAFTTHTNIAGDVANDSNFIGSIRGFTSGTLTLRNLGPQSAQYYWFAIGY